MTAAPILGDRLRSSGISIKRHSVLINGHSGVNAIYVR